MKSAKSKQHSALQDKRSLWVGVLFCLIVILFDLLVWYLGKNEYLAFLDIFTSWVTSGIIHMTGLHAVQDSNTIYLTNTVWIVTTECTAVFIMLIYSSFIFVYPADTIQKGIALGSGIPFIFGANILRLLIMAWIDKLKPEYNEFFHDYMWQVVFILMVVWMWMVWIDKVVNRETKISVSA